MKNLLTVFGLVVVVLLTSCSSSNHVTAHKRKYNKGYYVSAFNKRNKSLNSTEKQLANAVSKVVNTKVALTNTKPVNSASTSSNDGVNKSVTKYNNNEVNNHHLSQSVVKTNTSWVGKKAQARVKRKVEQLHKKSRSLDDFTILLLIMAIFPIFSIGAMYLKDDQSITANFWVNLILHLTIIGYAIFGVLVVLDVINLA